MKFKVWKSTVWNQKVRKCKISKESKVWKLKCLLLSAFPHQPNNPCRRWYIAPGFIKVRQQASVCHTNFHKALCLQSVWQYNIDICWTNATTVTVRQSLKQTFTRLCLQSVWGQYKTDHTVSLQPRQSHTSQTNKLDYNKCQSHLTQLKTIAYNSYKQTL